MLFFQKNFCTMKSGKNDTVGKSGEVDFSGWNAYDIFFGRYDFVPPYFCLQKKNAEKSPENASFLTILPFLFSYNYRINFYHC